MLILLHDRYKNKIVVNTDIIATVKEQIKGYSHNGYYTLSLTIGGEITILESPQEVKSLQDQAYAGIKDTLTGAGR